MQKKRLALIVMLFAGTVIAFTCLFNKIRLAPTFLIVSITLLVFYVIGTILQKVIDKINLDAERRAEQLVMEAAFEKNAAEVAAEEAEREAMENSTETNNQAEN